MNLQDLLDSKTLRTGVISVTMAILGYAGHAAIEVNKQGDILDAHTATIQELKKGQDETHHVLADLTTAVVRVEGKVDVVNQKIDDDREAKHR